MPRPLLVLFFSLFLQAQSGVEITAEPHHHLVLSNDQVRVFDAQLDPHAEAPMHWHRHDYIYIAIGAGDISNQVSGQPAAELKLYDGETRFSPGNFAHASRNLSDRPFRVLVVELLKKELFKDEKTHHAPPHWDPAHPEDDRGLQILEGGTKEILWYKDGVRASQIDLEPGSTLPADHPAHPRLVVALHDCDLTPTRVATHNHAPGHDHMHSMPAVPAAPAMHLKSGEVHWLPATDTNSLTNTGSTSAKFVTLEFR